ncbi:MAG: DNA repair protein RecN [uncultured Campylobacterales bacterium]|uniref:DNA repair protein RecN n=1 Tax=uncultured Campylobacterales bacterium TaxID=352960 RepID=A0A6S6SU62_9BACT|nr:MAG: DNA repair protein RecN [uncultured Campylobacterales bacterium]
MIDRLYIEDYLNFDKIDINLGSGLIVFSGVSGAGKSVLFNGILGVLGYISADAKKIDLEINNKLDLQDFGISSDDVNVFSMIRGKSQRFFINTQSISKKNINIVAKNFINYLSVKSSDEFENKNLLKLIDSTINSKAHNDNLSTLASIFKEYEQKLIELNVIKEKELKVEELKEFLNYEISKIEKLNPKIGELEELLETKKSFSKKEKILKLIDSINPIFEYESKVSELYTLLSIDSNEFNNNFNELKINVAEIEAKYENLDDDNIEKLLNRIEELSKLEKRHGSIEEALEQKKKKEKELELYINIELEKKSLGNDIKILESEITNIVNQITKTRNSVLPKLEKELNVLTSSLFINNASMSIEPTTLSSSGKDNVILKLNDTDIHKLSSGEYNRLRLSLLLMYANVQASSNGILLLDEVDSNLSGKEADAIANILQKLSIHYQILTISHQPQLSSKAHQHFVVEKNKEASVVRELSSDERVNEIARMVSGENITNEAKELARSLMQNGGK